MHISHGRVNGILDGPVRFVHSRRMQLGDYLVQHGLSHKDFAEMIEVDESQVWRYVNGRSTPRRPVMRRIEQVTEGAVTANDLLASIET